MKAQPTLPISGRRKVWRALPSALVLICMIVASPSLCAASGVWSVEHAASRVGFVTSFGGVRVAGDFPRWDAQIRFDPRDLSRASVVAVLDMRAVRTGNPDQEQALPTAVFFDATAFPQARFEAHTFRALGGDRYVAQGNLTLRGVTRPLTLPFTLSISNGVATMNGQAAISRLAFGVGQNEWKATDTLPDQVTATVSIRARLLP